MAISSEERHQVCWWAIFVVIVFLVITLCLVGMAVTVFVGATPCAYAEPKRLVDTATAQKVYNKKKAVKDNIPTLAEFEDDVDKAFPDKKQADVIKRLARAIHANVE
ncbi:MAG: hypothetical protein HQL06_13685 [Nitrospirae bacterium]|nr:hypothetical protein [Nitrospirota bacterium]